MGSVRPQKDLPGCVVGGEAGEDPVDIISSICRAITRALERGLDQRQQIRMEEIVLPPRLRLLNRFYPATWYAKSRVQNDQWLRWFQKIGQVFKVYSAG